MIQGRHSRRAFGRALLTIAIILVGLAPDIVASAQDSLPPKRVLMLYGHDPNAPGVVAFTNELHASVRSNSPTRVVFYDELLDLDRFPENAQREELVDYIVEKYRGFHFDAILTDGTRALKFAVDRVRVHFPNVPIVYGLGFEPEFDFGALPQNVTGIHHLLPFAETLKLAHALQPDAEQVVIIGGSSDTDSLLLATVYVSTDAKKNLRSYLAIVVDPIEVYVATDADEKKVNEDSRKALTNYFQHALTMAVSDAFPMVEKPGPLTLRLRVALVGVDVGGQVAAGAVSADSKPLENALNIGKLGVEMELVDSETGERIAAAVDRTDLGAGAEIGAVNFSREEKFAAAREAFDEWASRLRGFLDSAHELKGDDMKRADQSYKPY